MSSPALHALRRRFTNARIVVLARPHVVPALEGSDDIDEIIVYDVPGRHGGLTGWLRLASELRRRSFDLAVLFQKAFDAAALALAAGIPRRYGYATDKRRWLLTDPIPENDAVRARHHARVFLDLSAAAGANASCFDLRFPLSPADRERAARTLEAAGVGAGEPLVSVHAGASKRPRAWHPDRFGQLAREAVRLTGGRAMVLGATGDASVARRVADTFGEGIIDLTGRTTLREMAAVFERSCLFLGSDSGPMHIAAAVGTPVLAVFGPGTPSKTAPFVDPSRYEVLTRRFPCSPCRQAFFCECESAPSGKPYCIEEISVSQAVEAVGRLLTRTRPSSA
jgi:lipopolysaccharide heptosyltransferase II